eukprot:COSAG01_NODE_4231_length_5222_cov_25.632832_5_plen_171_part_00
MCSDGSACVGLRSLDIVLWGLSTALFMLCVLASWITYVCIRMVCKNHLARWFEHSSGLATLPALTLALGSGTLVFAASTRLFITVGNDIGYAGGVAAGLPVLAFLASIMLWHKLASATTGIQCCGGSSSAAHRVSYCKFTCGALGLCRKPLRNTISTHGYHQNPPYYGAN